MNRKRSRSRIANATPSQPVAQGWSRGTHPLIGLQILGRSLSLGALVPSSPNANNVHLYMENHREVKRVISNLEKYSHIWNVINIQLKLNWTSLVVQWLRLRASSAGSTGSIPRLGEVPQAMGCCQNLIN